MEGDTVKCAMSQREDALKFETGRIKALQEERLHIQKKTFTKWMNSFLAKARMEVEDLFLDLADGKKLLKLLEIISGEKLGKPNNGKMRFHKIENVNKSLAFLHTKVRLESIGAEDIVDGNPRLILGLIWTIILRFQIQEIEIDVDEENESSEKKSAKDALLLWCQRKTNGYKGVNIQDFSGSWRNGLGFNALIHSHRPDLIDFNSLSPHEHIDNLNNAFDVAHKELGIAKLLDAEDIDTNKPDEKSVMTYVASYYHTFAKMKNEMKGGRRIANILNQMMDIDRQKEDYERLSSDLLNWINEKIEQLEDHNFPNSLDDIQKQLLQFKMYRTEEKPPKYRERSEIEAKLFATQTKLKALGQSVYIPPEGKMVQDIERAWDQLEKAEHKRELALRGELMRQERLEQLAYKFEKKSVLREGYLKEMTQVLSDPRYGSNLAQIEATVKKHETISADILARTERFHDLRNMAEELVKEDYHGSEQVNLREKAVMKKWDELLQLLENRKDTLNKHNNLMSIIREMDTVSSQIQNMQDKFSSEDYGRHLLAVEDLLEKHSLLESQIVIQGESIRRLNRQTEQFKRHEEAPILKNHMQRLHAQFDNLEKLSAQRRNRLEDSRDFFQFLQDHEEEEAWLQEKQRICNAPIVGKDLLAILSLQQKHKALEDEMNARQPKSEQLCHVGESLIAQSHQEANEIKNRINSLRTKWKHLIHLAEDRKTKLDDATETYQYYADANEADSWMNEKLPLVASKDYGKDEPSAQSLLQRHGHLEGEIKAYEGDLDRLNEQAAKLVQNGLSSLPLIETSPPPDEDEFIDQVVLIPYEVEVDQIVDREVIQDVIEKRQIPQVRASFSFSGQGIHMQKGEVMRLLSKTNDDWWSVRKSDNSDGFVPANYLKEIEPQIVNRVVKKPVIVKQTERVKQTRTKEKIVRTKVAPKLSSGKTNPSDQRDTDTVQQRQNKINTTYNKLRALSKARREYLEDAIQLFGFFRECDDFKAWMTDKEKMLNTDDDTESVEQMKRKFENFLTDLSTSAYRVDVIDEAVAEFAQHEQEREIRRRQKEIHDQWNRLNRLKAAKEKSLEGATSVELFNRTCDEARDWMLEKMDKMDNDELGKDLKTVQALQRKHENVERELAPVEEKYNRVNLLANSVKSSYPNEKQNVNARQKELGHLWHDVKDKALNRRARLEEAVGQQIFNNTARNLLLWMHGVKDQLNTDEPIRDVSTAKNALKKHDELKDDMRAHKDEFKELAELGEGLTKSQSDGIAIVSKLAQLQNEYQSLEDAWKQKEDKLQQVLKLQLFNREADQIDALTTSHETFLDYDDLGTSTDNVVALLKRHEDFENTLVAQDERVAALERMADDLINIPHFESEHIENRKNQVANRRLALKDKAAARKQALLASKSFYEFKADADEMMSWIQDKKKVASDESYRDLSNLQRKLKKHEAFEGELKANERRLATINRTGQSLVAKFEHRADEINESTENLRTEWERLWLLTNDKGRKLRQAVAQHMYNKTLEDAKMKLAEMENALQSTDFGNDLRSVKQLLKKHQMLENDIKVWNTKIDEVIRLGEDMAKDGHFDAPAILKQTHELKERFKQLQQPALKRRQQLEKSLKLHQFNFEADGEKQWIAEHIRSTSSTDIGQNLIEAQNILKKHLKLEREVAGHKPVIDKTLEAGKALIDENHYASEEIKEKSEEIMNAWDNLFELAKDRKKRLELSLKAQQFFSEANEVESWLNEKNEILSNQDYGRDEDATVKLLTKHKTLELEMDSYCGLITEMGCQAAKMIENKHPDSKLIMEKQKFIDQQMEKLQEMANARRQLLIESKHKHEYCRESDNFENWIEEQIQVALSEEYGQDYEHLLLLQSKFEDFKHRVDASAEQFVQEDELANKLIANGSIFSDEIEKKQMKLRELWQLLMDHIDSRDQKLQAAAEIHRFNRDIAEAIQRMQDKYASISDDLGRDLNSVLSLLRKHEGFENDLVAIEAQLQVLIDDSSRLQNAYPGGNAEHIQMQQDVMLDHWNALKERSTQRKEELKHSCDFQRFLASVRDLIDWANTLRTAMMAEERVRDAASAQLLKTDHERLKAEIEAREESFTAVVHNGEFMIKSSHYAKNEIREKLTQLLEARQKLHSTWQHKKIYLDQLIDLHFFLRDAKQLDAMSATQEAFLTSGEYGSSVEEVESQVRKHDAFEKLLCTQDDKLVALQTHGSKLIEQNHFDAQNIKKRLEDVTARRRRVRELCANEKLKLTDALLYAQFNRDVTEAEIGIEEKQKKLDSEIESADPTDLEEKINRLQKHQAFQSELTAHEGKIKDIKQNGNTLLNKRHHESVNIRQKLQHLLQMWNRLLTDSNNRGRGLEEAQDILLFNNHVEKVEAWIREKEMMIQADDNGRDYEHCLALQRKLDDVDSDMQVDEARIIEINNLADKLMCQGPSDTRNVQTRKDELNQKWKALQGAIQDYRERLAAALEVHAFNRDVDDTKDRINEKMLLMSSEDCGKNLPAVETLQRKQETLERDMTAIENKLKEHDAEARRLIQKYVEVATPIRNKLSHVQDNWRNLTNRCHMRKQLLASSYTFQKFMAEMRELELWVGEMISRMNSNQLPKEVAEAESFLQLHQERKAEIDGRQDSFKTLKAFGYHLIQKNHSAKEELEDSLLRLEELRRTLMQAWEERKQILSQCLDLQLFYEQVELAHAWLASKEALLNNEDLGDSMSSVEALIRKHETFEKTVQVQNNKIDQLEKFATELIAGKHYASTEIQSNIHAICERRDRLKELAMVRRRKLLESKQLQQFLRNNYEVLGWIQTKMTVACDENYREASNLQRKIQKHQVFEAELAANKSRVNNVNTEGEGLIGAGHFAGMEIQTQLDELESKWRQLMDMSQLKKERLNDAHEAYVFNRLLEDLEIWMDETETLLQSEDHGKDLISVQNLLKKHQALENDVNNHADNIKTVKDATQTFANNNNFMGAQLQDKAQSIIERYSLLHEPVQIRRDNLEDALFLYRFYRDVDDEMAWIAEKESLASSTDLGSSLTAVQNLQKKHQVLEAEIQTHEPLVVAVSTMVQQMTRNAHFASVAIESRGHELQVKWQQLKDQTTVRRLRLLDAVESQLFYSDANEMEIWIKDRLHLLNSQDLGKDEDSAQVLLKKMDVLERDVDAFNNNVIQLYKLKQKLTERGHFDSHNIEAKHLDVETQYAQLKLAAEDRRKRLNDNKKFLKYLREVDELMETLGEQITVANIEDYGRDLEHVEILIKKFERFISSLVSSEERVLAVKNQGEILIEEGCKEREIIRNKIKELFQMWEELNDHVNLRQEALLGAKQVHELDRNADETISWIQEKDQLISSDDFGHDLESIQMLIRKHEGFERDLAAIKDRVECIVKEARHLAEIFPDARTHVGSRHEETVDAWNRLLDKSAQRKDKLHQAEELQAYFDEYRDLMAWLSEMMAKITASNLAQDVRGAELLLTRHQEYRAEIDTRLDVFAQFARTGELLISQGHFMADEIQEKICRLDSNLKSLLTTWEERQFLYEENLDTQMFKRDADALDAWLEGRAVLLHATDLGESISQVEDLLRKHDDFEKTVEAQEEKFAMLKRITLLEKHFLAQQEKEAEQRKKEAQRREQDRIDAMKRKEHERILNERKREDDRRRTTEIRFGKDQNAVNGDGNLFNSSSDRLNKFPSVESLTSSQGLNSKRLSLVEMPEIKPLNLSNTQRNKENVSDASVRRGESMRVDKLETPIVQVKRSESMKLDEQQTKGKRTPSFTTKRRSQSFRKNKKGLDAPRNLPPVEMEGFTDRKQELQSGGKRATIRSWKTLYSVLCGQLLCFFKDKDDFIENKAASPPLGIHQAKCSRAQDYTKKKFVFRLQPADGAEYLFTVDTAEAMSEWINKINFHANLPPRMQLLSYRGESAAEATILVQEMQNANTTPAQPIYVNFPLDLNMIPENENKSKVQSDNKRLPSPVLFRENVKRQNLASPLPSPPLTRPLSSPSSPAVYSHVSTDSAFVEWYDPSNIKMSQSRTRAVGLNPFDSSDDDSTQDEERVVSGHRSLPPGSMPPSDIVIRPHGATLDYRPTSDTTDVDAGSERKGKDKKGVFQRLFKKN